MSSVSMDQINTPARFFSLAYFTYKELELFFIYKTFKKIKKAKCTFLIDKTSLFLPSPQQILHCRSQSKKCRRINKVLSYRPGIQQYHLDGIHKPSTHSWG
jgi:hypothetical protein